MNRQSARSLVHEVASGWAADDASDVVWAGEHDGRIGVRMAQQTRDYTTLWFDVGDITVGFEAYLLPAPPRDPAEVYRQCLVRNMTSWPAHLALDRDGELVVVGRIPLALLSREELDRVLGAVYQLVELAFRPLVRAGFTAP
ncbi:MAG TPA: YbjN domain-containing protein [Acidimicrobiia bacterium]